MNQVQLSDVQIANLTLLLTIRDGILHDRTAACCRFSLDAMQAERLGTMSVADATAALEAVGLRIAVQRTDLYVGLDRVVRQRPGTGDSVPKGDVVTVYVV